MRAWRLTVGDIRFQWKYGFYAVYAIFTAVYLLALSVVPISARRVVAAVMIFTDPAAMGLFFMGAIVLLEKSQRVNSSLAVTPIRVWEYVLAKLLSLACISVAVGLILAVAGGLSNIGLCVTGILLTSCLCSACGLIAAIKSSTLNQFILFAVPFELWICLPPVLLLFGVDAPILMAHPGAAAIWLIYGDAPNALLCILSLAVWCVPTLYWCIRTVKRGFAAAEGAAA